MKKHIIGAIMLTVVMFVAGTAFAQGERKAFGKTYGEWSADWWQWALEMPATHHPLFDTADCSNRQSGHVWFLGGKFCAATSQIGCSSPGTVTAERSCTIGPETALFFPILNGEDSYVEELAGTSEQTLRTNIKSWTDPSPNFMITASVDGWPLHPVRICTSGTFCSPEQSPLFFFRLPHHDNLMAAIGETWVPDGALSAGVSDGYYVLLPPLPVGHHTIFFYGRNGGFSLDITYHITVRHESWER